MLRVRGGAVEARLETLINPQRPLSEHAFVINGIGPEQLANAPDFAAVADELVAQLTGVVVVAHNVLFDLEFLHVELGRLGRVLPDIPTIDTLALARHVIPKRRSYSLAELAAALGASPPAHRAMADVVALRAVFDDLAERLAQLAVVTGADVLRYARGFAPGDPEPAPPPLIAKALHDRRLLRIVYDSYSFPNPVERVIKPLEIAQLRGTLYLRAYCHLRDDLRAFALPKILEMEFV